MKNGFSEAHHARIADTKRQLLQLQYQMDKLRLEDATAKAEFAPIKVHVFKNGDELHPGVGVVVTRNQFKHWLTFLEFVTNRLEMHSFADRLYDMTGKDIRHLKQLEDGKCYVAASGNFLKMNYKRGSNDDMLNEPKHVGHNHSMVQQNVNVHMENGKYGHETMMNSHPANIPPFNDAAYHAVPDHSWKLNVIEPTPRDWNKPQAFHDQIDEASSTNEEYVNSPHHFEHLHGPFQHPQRSYSTNDMHRFQPSLQHSSPTVPNYSYNNISGNHGYEPQQQYYVPEQQRRYSADTVSVQNYEGLIRRHSLSVPPHFHSTQGNDAIVGQENYGIRNGNNFYNRRPIMSDYNINQYHHPNRMPQPESHRTRFPYLNQNNVVRMPWNVNQTYQNRLAQNRDVAQQQQPAWRQKVSPPSVGLTNNTAAVRPANNIKGAPASEAHLARFRPAQLNGKAEHAKAGAAGQGQARNAPAATVPALPVPRAINNQRVISRNGGTTAARIAHRPHPIRRYSSPTNHRRIQPSGHSKGGNIRDRFPHNRPWETQKSASEGIRSTASHKKNHHHVPAVEPADKNTKKKDLHQRPTKINPLFLQPVRLASAPPVVQVYRNYYGKADDHKARRNSRKSGSVEEEEEDDDDYAENRFNYSRTPSPNARHRNESRHATKVR